MHNKILTMGSNTLKYTVETVESDLAPVNIWSCSCPYHRAQNRQDGACSQERQRSLVKPHDDDHDKFDKNCSLSIMLTAMDQKLQKS